jgi:tetratricopeptide (TPR) repeat protein
MALLQQGIAEFQKFTPQGNQLSEELLLKAHKRSPESWAVLVNLGWATWYTGWATWYKVIFGQSENPGETFAKAREYATKSVEVNARNAYGYALLGWIDMYAGDHDAALKNANRAVELSPNGGIATSVAGWVMSNSGHPECGAELCGLACAPNLNYPDWIPFSLAASLMVMGQLDGAKELLLALNADASPTVRQWSQINLTVIAVWQGDIDLARQYAAKSPAENPGTSIAMSRRYNSSIKDQAYLERIFEALRRAGWPENPPPRPTASD